MLQNIEIIGLGKALPSNEIPNQRFEEFLDTSDEWISQRTGIRSRRYCNSEETSATLSIAAASEAITDANCDPQEIDLIVCGTVTPETTTPTNASKVQTALGCRTIPAFDVSAACSGFLYSLSVAESFIQSGKANTALVIGAEALSRCLNFEDRNTCILFGDGAGAAVVRKRDSGQAEGSVVLNTHIECIGDPDELIRVPPNAGTFNCLATMPDSMSSQNGSALQVGLVGKLPSGSRSTIELQGREVFRFAINAMEKAIHRSVASANKPLSKIDMVVPHQVNTRVFDAVSERLGIPKEKFFTNISKYGNTSAASIPIALQEAAAQGYLKRGDLVSLVAFGGGLTCSSALIRW